MSHHVEAFLADEGGWGWQCLDPACNKEVTGLADFSTAESMGMRHEREAVLTVRPVDRPECGHHDWPRCAHESPPEEAPVTLLPLLPADLVDQMLTSIRTQLVDARYDDPQLAPDLMNKTLVTLQAAIERGGKTGVFAADLLQQLWHRTESGVPYGEPQEPGWPQDADSEPCCACPLGGTGFRDDFGSHHRPGCIRYCDKPQEVDL